MNDKEKMMKTEETAVKKEDDSLITDFDTLRDGDKQEQDSKPKSVKKNTGNDNQTVKDKALDEQADKLEKKPEKAANSEREKNKNDDNGKEKTKKLAEVKGAKEEKQEKAEDAKAEKQEKAEDAKAEKQEKAGDTKAEKPEKPEKAGDTKAEKPEKPEKAEDTKAEKPEKQEKAGDTKTEKPRKSNDSKAEKAEDNEAELVGKAAAISQSKRLVVENAAKGKTKKESSGGKKALWIVLGTIAAMVCIVYIAGFIYFSGHFYQDVAINGVDVSNMDKSHAKQVLDRFYQDYVLTIITIENKEVQLKGSDISMQIALRDEFDDCLAKQEAALWFVNMTKHHDYEIGADASWNDGELTMQFDSMSMLNKQTMVEPKDAYVSVEDSQFVIVKEILGTTLDIDKFKSAVADSLRTVQFSLNLKDKECYELPAVYETDEELVKELEAKNEYADREIKLQLDDLTLEPGMQLYEDVLEKSGDAYIVSKELVSKYVKKLAKKYDTLGTDRVFTTSFSDKKVTVNGTAFGYEMNQEETIDKLYSALTSGKAATVEAVFNKKGYTLTGENDIGDTYVEVNLSEQKVVAYKNGKKIAEGDCVSGKESVGHGTCIGLYAIQDKLSPTVLRGEKKPVSKTEIWFDEFGQPFEHTTTTMEYDYESPVTFWMQFNGGIGLHDAAQWRSAYGGSIYYYSGSHGCVNLPYDLAKTLYETFQIGDPVVVYFWDNENRR